jgi:uncharacterized protein
VLRVVLDTNQLVSSLLSTQGLQAQLIDAWRRRAYVLLLAPGQIDEVGEVLGRPKIAKKYAVPPCDRGAFLDLLRAEAILLPDAPAPAVCRDPDDDDVLGCAMAGAADYLVTGDADLLSLSQYRGVSIVGAREFLSLIYVAGS